MGFSSDTLSTPALQLPSRLLAYTGMLAGARSAAALATMGAHTHHFAILAVLDHWGQSSQAEIARLTGIDRSDVTNVSALLEASGFVDRITDVNDQRRVLVTLTGPGRQRLRSMRACLDPVQSNLLRSLSSTDQETLVRILTTILSGTV